MSERLGGHAEANYGPGVAEALSFLKTYDEIQAALGWLVEASASAPLLRVAKRAKLQRLMQKLGIDTTNSDDPGGYKQLAQLKTAITDRSLHPKPRVEVPDADFFAGRIKAVKAGRSFGASFDLEPPADTRVSILDVVQYGHTNWSGVQSRTGHLTTEIHRIATVMADPIAYHAWAFEAQGHAADHIAIGEDWSIQNGRHRSLAAICLGEDFISSAGIDTWIPVVVEQS
jgi:hypothetical protein